MIPNDVQGMLLEPEEGNSESCAVSVAPFRTGQTPYTGARRNPRMTQPRFAKPVINRVTANASTSSLLLRSSTSIDHGRPSTSRAGTEQATAILEDGARFPETSSVGQWNTQYHMANGTSSVPGTLQPRDLSHSGELAPVLSGHTDNTEDGSTGFRLPVYSSSGGDDAVASAISAGIEEASGVLGNEARFFSHVAFDRKYL
ncbi:uncharacterized protein [Dermacentor andersoni]|uniref:uncharacterized protein n=1 Tax=Dermacentor andersoni TaxID=34620 RepID=UPI003B3A1D3B